MTMMSNDNVDDDEPYLWVMHDDEPYLLGDV